MCRATGFRTLFPFVGGTDIRPSIRRDRHGPYRVFLSTAYRTVGIMVRSGLFVKGGRHAGMSVLENRAHKPEAQAKCVQKCISFNVLRLRFRLVASDFPGIVCILDADRSRAVELGSWSSHRQREVFFSVHGNTDEEASDERETASHPGDHHRRPAL